MQGKYDLVKMLVEIKDDEKVSGEKRDRLVSQEEIVKEVMRARRERKGILDGDK